MPTREEQETKERADRALRAGRPAEALPLYRELLERVVVMEPGVYEGWLEGALAAYRALGRARAAGYVAMALGRHAEAVALLAEAGQPLALALCQRALGQDAAAAETLERAGYLVQLAVLHEAAQDWPRAAALWGRLLQAARLRARPYETALALLRRGRVAREQGQGEAARRDASEAMRLLEGLADEHEARGLRERAFDCYFLMLEQGRRDGVFENLAEGYAGAIRVLMSEHDPYLPLQYADDFIALARAAGEWQAAAAIAADAAAHARRMNLSFARHYIQRAASLWEEGAAHLRAGGAPPEFVESALLSAIDVTAALPDLPRMGRLYRQLAELDLPGERVGRYAQLATRLAAAGQSASEEPGLPEHFLQPNPYPDIGLQDLIEWELAGDASATLLLILHEQARSVRFSRQALRALLVIADLDEAVAPGAPAPNQRGWGPAVAAALGGVPLYQVLAPLEQLLGSPDPETRAQVQRSAALVLSKRSFQIVRRGLQDPDARVREEARRALRSLRFRDGLEPQIRMFRELREPAVREVALAAIADIGTLQAAVFLLDVVRQDEPELSVLAADRLTTFRLPELLPLVRARHDRAQGNERALLRSVLVALESSAD